MDSVADYLIFNMKKNGAYEVKDPAVINQLVELVTKEGKPQDRVCGQERQVHPGARSALPWART